MPTIQRMQHTSVPMAPNGQDQVRRFYGGVLGLEEIPRPRELGARPLVWFRTGADGQELHCFEEADLGANATAQHVCFEVDDIEAMRARLSAHDVAIEETQPIKNRPRCFVRDPSGNLIELTQFEGPYDPMPQGTD